MAEEKKKTSSTTTKKLMKDTVSRGKNISERKKDVYRRIERVKRVRPKRKRRREENEGFDVRLVSIRRVAKVRAGGKRLKLSVMVVVGDKKGNVGVAVAKGKDVRDAQNKAVQRAKKKMIHVPLKGTTIPHEITEKHSAAKVFLKPAPPGTGVIAGSAVRAVVEVAGVKDILSKELGSKNIIPNVYATYQALKKLRLTRFENETK